MIRSAIAVILVLMGMAQVSKPFVFFRLRDMTFEVQYLGTFTHPLLKLAHFAGVYAPPAVALTALVGAILGRLFSKRLRRSNHAMLLNQYKDRWRYIFFAVISYAIWYVSVDHYGVADYQWMLCVALWLATSYGVSLTVKDIWYMFDHPPQGIDMETIALKKASQIEFRRDPDGAAHVYIEGKELGPKLRLEVKDYGASGFDWGHDSPGASQLALALMLELYMSDTEAVRRGKRFKEDFLVGMGWEGTVSGDDVYRWLKRQRRFVLLKLVSRLIAFLKELAKWIARREGCIKRDSVIEFRRKPNGKPEVFIDGVELKPERSLLLLNQNAFGFDWGTVCSAPASSRWRFCSKPGCLTRMH